MLACCWSFHWNLSLPLDQDGPWDGPAAEDWFHRCRKHGLWHHKGHLVWWVIRELLKRSREVSTKGVNSFLCVPVKGNVLPVNVKVSAPSSRNLGRFQVLFFPPPPLLGWLGLQDTKQFRIMVTVSKVRFLVNGQLSCKPIHAHLVAGIVFFCTSFSQYRVKIVFFQSLSNLDKH